ncbi:MAG: DMT family transporter [Pseudomonadota bacterium]|nr:DMT family transporter [Pseudomonadota bacterium]
MTAPIPSPAPPPSRARFVAPAGAVLGVLYMIGFCVTGPMIDISAKLAAATLPVGVIALARFVTQSTLLCAWLILRPEPMPPLRALPAHFARGALIAGATMFFFAALRHMPVPDAMAIFFVEPMVLTLLGAALLREQVGWRRYLGCAIGFAGALLIIQPSFEEVGVPALYPLGTAACFALYMILTRRLGQQGGVAPMQALAGISGGIVTALALWAGAGTGNPHFDPVWPEGAEWALLAGVGLFATLSHILIVLALRHAPASVAAPVQYLEIVFAALYSWWVFREFPDLLTWAGIAVVAGSGLYVLHREQRAQARAAAAEAAAQAAARAAAGNTAGEAAGEVSKPAQPS